MTKIMAIVNLTPDSFWAPSRVSSRKAAERLHALFTQGADMIDLGAVSTRPGAAPVSLFREWRRLRPVLKRIAADPDLRGRIYSIDTTRAEIVRRAYGIIGPFIVNDISAGEDDPDMLSTVGELGLSYVAMHKRGDPRTMDGLCDYPEGLMPGLKRYFEVFAVKAEHAGIKDWILDPGLGFAKTEEQNWAVLEHLDEFKTLGRPILIGVADKRFTHGDNSRAHRIGLEHGADILRVHDVTAAAGDIAHFSAAGI